MGAGSGLVASAEKRTASGAGPAVFEATTVGLGRAAALAGAARAIDTTTALRTRRLYFVGSTTVSDRSAAAAVSSR